MRIRLEYGRTGLEASLEGPTSIELLEPVHAVPLDDPHTAIETSLQRPIGTASLGALAKGKRDACILVCDITRPVPNEAILTPMLRILEESGIFRSRIRILIATGLHRGATPVEIEEIVGSDIAHDYRIENHDGRKLEDHVYLGTTPRGVPAWVDRRYVEADLKVAVGLIEPHLMAGFSGGRKLICPGVASLETIRAWHSPRFLEHPRAACGIVEGNPVHEENTRIARMAGCDFIANVCLDGQRQITSVVAGDMERAWDAGVRDCRKQLEVRASRAADVVVTSSAGYPLDTTFYQSVKGMTGVLPIVREGGTIILVASMSEGIGSREFQDLLETTESLDTFVDQIARGAFFVVDQWQLEELAKVRRHCRVKVVTDGVAAETLEKFFVEPACSVEGALADSIRDYGSSVHVAVVPKGPYVLPVLA